MMDITNQTLLGFWWIIIRTLFPYLGLFFIVHSMKLFEGISPPYSFTLLSGMLLWVLVNHSLVYGVRTFIRLRKFFNFRYVPRLTGVLSSFVFATLNFFVVMIFLLGVSLYFLLIEEKNYFDITPNMLLIFPIVCAVYFFLIGVVSWLSVLCLIARDVKLSMPLVRQFWFVITPVAYPLTELGPSVASFILFVNPIAVYVEVLRWCLFGVGYFEITHLISAIIATGIIFFSGVWFVFRSEKFIKSVL